MSNTVEVVNLFYAQQFIPIVSQWIWEEWDKDNKKHTLEDIIYRSKHSINENTTPMMFMALYNNEPAGVISIWNNDLKNRQDLTPYIGTFFIQKQFRGRGVDRALMKAVIEACRRIGYEYIYFWTHWDNYYLRKGAEFMETVPYEFGETVNLYRYKL